MFKSILVPVDLAHQSSWEHAVPQAVELAASASGTVVVMTVIRDLKAAFEGAYFPFQFELMASEAQAKLEGIIDMYNVKRIPMKGEVYLGSIGHEILQTAARSKSDLIIMASHRPKLKDHFIGPNAAYVAQRATCSVLVLRQPEVPLA
jgi:nucleotide-binding universal stress UspA family protein